MNAGHAKEYEAVTKKRRSDEQHSSRGRDPSLSDGELNRAAPVSLYFDAPLTWLVLEDHALRHSYHHLGRLSRVLKP